MISFDDIKESLKEFDGEMARQAFESLRERYRLLGKLALLDCSEIERSLFVAELHRNLSVGRVTFSKRRFGR